MFKHLLSILIILNVTLSSLSTQHTVDSLLNLEKNWKGSDSLKADLYSNLAIQFYNIDFEKMKLYSEKAIKISEQSKYIKGEVDANHRLALYYRLNGKTDTAIILNKKALDLSHKIGYVFGKAKCNLALGNIAKLTNRFDVAVEYYSKSAKQFKEINYTVGAAAVIFNKSVILKKQSKYSEALKGYNQSLTLYKKSNDKKNQAMVYRSIAILYNSIGDVAKATNNYLLALKLHQDSNDKFGESSTQNSIGKLYLEHGDYEDALLYLNRSFKNSQISNNRQNASFAAINIGIVYLKQKNHNRALTQFKKALIVCHEIKINKLVAIAYNGIAKIYIHKGQDSIANHYLTKALEIRKTEGDISEIIKSYITIANYHSDRKALTKAEHYYLKAFKLTKVTKKPSDIRDVSKCLSDIYEKLDNFKSSLTYYKLYETMSDSLINESKAKKITRQLLNFEHRSQLTKIEAKQKENKIIQEKEKAILKATRNYYFLGFIFFILLSIVVLLALRRKKLANKNLKRYNIDIIKKNLEIEITSSKLKDANSELIKLDNFKQSMTSMIVHDMKNPLNNILNYPLTEKDDYIEVAKASGNKILHLVQNILDVKKLEETDIKTEIESLNIFSLINRVARDIEYILNEKNINLTIDANKTLHCLADNYLIERVVLNILINSVKFSENNGTISIICSEEGKLLKIAISDMGVGIPESKIANVFSKFGQVESRNSGSIRSTGLGLTYCKMAVEAHNQQIGIESNEGSGTTIWFYLEKDELDNNPVQISEKLSDKKLNAHELSESNIAILQPFTDRLKKTPVYKSSAIRKILLEIETSDKSIVSWKKKVTNSVYRGNKILYNSLINHSEHHDNRK